MNPSSVMATCVSQRGKRVATLPLTDFNSVKETLHLLSNPKNAQRLSNAIEQIKVRRAQARDLMRGDVTETEKQEYSQERPHMLG